MIYTQGILISFSNLQNELANLSYVAGKPDEAVFFSGTYWEVLMMGRNVLMTYVSNLKMQQETLMMDWDELIVCFSF